MSIGRKLIVSYVTISLVCVIIMESLFFIALQQYYVSGMEQTLINHAEASAVMYNKYAPAGNIMAKSTFIKENMNVEEKALIEVYDDASAFVTSNSGGNISRTEITPDYQEALQGKTSMWRGSTTTKEEIMSVSVPLMDRDKIVGVLRYVSSMGTVNEIMRANITLALTIGVAIVLVSTLIGYMMSSLILIPVKDLIRVTREITTGNLDVKAKRYYRDEIGQLSEAVNQMTEEIKRSNQAKNDFISSISHELRTPLTSIKGWSETIEDNPADIEITSLGVEIINNESNRLIRLVNDLLDFSKLQSHRIELDCALIWTDEFLTEIYYQFSARASQEGISLRLHLDGQNAAIMADESRMRQVLINVIDNAFKFVSGRLRPEIILETDMLDDQVVITVEDNGPGMTTEALARVKEKFYKGSSKLSGTGLGLSIANEIIELHDGTMYFDSIRGVGTKVSLVIPLTDALPTEAELSAMPVSANTTAETE